MIDFFSRNKTVSNYADSLHGKAIQLASALDETSYSDSTGMLVGIEHNIEWLIPLVGIGLFAIHIIIKLCAHTFSQGGKSGGGGGLSVKEIVNQAKIYGIAIVAVDLIPIIIKLAQSMEKVAR